MSVSGDSVYFPPVPDGDGRLVKGEVGCLSRQVIGVTGGIGSGKSRVARWLAQECAYSLYDADAEVRSLLVPDAAGWQRLHAWLSPDFFGADGFLRKDQLRLAIFNDNALRQAVEVDLHPLVLANLQAKIVQREGPCLVEVPLLYEVGWQDYFDGVLVAYAPDALCCERITHRDRIPVAEAWAAIRIQMPIQEKVARADYRVDNSGAWDDTQRQLEEIKRGWCPQSGKK